MLKRKSKYFVVTHTFAEGLTQELRAFLIKNKVTFAFVEQPFSFNKGQKRPRISFYKEGKVNRVFEGLEFKGPEVLRFVKDLFSTIILTLRLGEKFDICISADPLNTSAAWILGRLGYFKKLVYYTVDYTPKRFENKLLNSVYHLFDRFCCYRSDLMWDSSVRMRGIRAGMGLDLKKCARGFVVRDGCHFKAIKRLPERKGRRFKLVFMGHLIAGKGVDLILRSLPKVLEKFPQVTLTVIGEGPEAESLKALTRKLGIAKSVTFTGFIKSHKKVEEIITRCGIALAAYVPDPASFTFFSDVGKVKVYLACGLPVLITDVPEIAKEIETNRAGAIFEYQEDSLVEELDKLLGSEKLYLRARKNAIAMAKNLDWDNVFEEALDKTAKLLDLD